MTHGGGGGLLFLTLGTGLFIGMGFQLFRVSSRHTANAATSSSSKIWLFVLVLFLLAPASSNAT